VTIADTGCGISRDALPNIFDQFFSTKSHGNGIGLSQVRDVVQEHAGVLLLNLGTITIEVPPSGSRNLQLIAGVLHPDVQ
jgi:signal transduction histidine kinase